MSDMLLEVEKSICQRKAPDVLNESNNSGCPVGYIREEKGRNREEQRLGNNNTREA